MDFSLLLALWVLGVDWDLGRPVVVTLVVVGIAFRIAVGIAVVVPISLGIVLLLVLLVLLDCLPGEPTDSVRDQVLPEELSDGQGAFDQLLDFLGFIVLQVADVQFGWGEEVEEGVDRLPLHRRLLAASRLLLLLHDLNRGIFRVRAPVNLRPFEGVDVHQSVLRAGVNPERQLLVPKVFVLFKLEREFVAFLVPFLVQNVLASHVNQVGQNLGVLLRDHLLNQLAVAQSHEPEVRDPRDILARLGALIFLGVRFGLELLGRFHTPRNDLLA
mmetsp:Transcript_14436/g.41209  ORF Transcript_14436/g.41209 Transcript_14436/m.41209 type:complete len:272 (+) Transcript_14436:80-895(+)